MKADHLSSPFTKKNGTTRICQLPQVYPAPEVHSANTGKRDDDTMVVSIQLAVAVPPRMMDTLWMMVLVCPCHVCEMESSEVPDSGPTLKC